jgi:arylformamidase
MRLIDISGPIYTGMWSSRPEYPGAEITPLPEPAGLPPGLHVYLDRLVISGQTGTYIETKAHIDPTGTPVTDLPLTEFWREAVVLHVRRKEPRERITAEELEACGREIRPGDAVLIATGWDRMWREAGFCDDSPFIAREAAYWLMERQIGLLGADIPRFDNVQAPEFPWVEFFERVPLLLAPCTNLGQVTAERATLICFPLKIEGACSAPCRAAIVEPRIALEE